MDENVNGLNVGEKIENDIERNGEGTINQDNNGLENPSGKPKKTMQYVMAGIIVLAIALAAGIYFYMQSPSKQVQKQLDLGNRYLAELNYEEAIAAFEKAIAIDPMNVDAYIGMANTYLTMGNREKAIEILTKGFEATNDERLTALKKQIETDIAEEKLRREEEKRRRAEERNRAKVAPYEKNLVELAKDIYEDKNQTPDWQLYSFAIEEFMEQAGILFEPAIFEEDDGLFLAVYPGGNVYYGHMKDKSREGYGVWFTAGVGEVNTSKGNWVGDKPNGMTTIEFIRDESFINKQPGHTYGVHTIEKVNVNNGVYNGDSDIVWIMDRGAPHHWVVPVIDGYSHEVGICTECGATLSPNPYQQTIFGFPFED